ncbi:hypothetical protein ACOSQ2_013523 [Xanthoceras sorbifolium]
MATAQTIIDVQNGKLSMTVLRETFEFQLEKEIEEDQTVDPKIGLGVKQNSKRKNKPKPCPNKPLGPKPNFDDIGGCEELQLQLLGYLNPMKGELSRHRQIVDHAADGVLDMH